MSSEVIRKEAQIPSKHTLPNATENEAFWTKYVNANAASQKTMRESADFPRYVWAGIPAEHRPKLWCTPFDAPPTKFTPDNKSGLDEEIKRELQNASACEGFSLSLDDTEKELIRVVIQIDVGMYNLSSVREGCVQLLAHMLGVSQTISATLQCYQWLCHRSRQLWQYDQDVIDNWSLVTAELIAQHIPSLAGAFRVSGVNVHDLVSLYRGWFLPLLSCHFPPSYVHRVIDIVLYDPVAIKAIIPVMVGLLLDVYLGSTTDREDNQASVLSCLFQSQHNTLSPTSTHNAFQYGYALARTRMTAIDEWASKKNWKCAVSGLKMSGLVIQTGVGEIPIQHNDDIHIIQLERVRALLKEVNEARREQNDIDIRNIQNSNLHLSPVSSQHASPNSTSPASPDDDSLAVKIRSAINSIEPLVNNPATCTPELAQSLKDLQSILQTQVSVYPVSSIKTNQHPSNIAAFVPREPNSNGLVKYSELGYYLQFPCAHMEGYLLKAKVVSAATNNNPTNTKGTNVDLDQELSPRFFVLQGPYLTHFISHLHTTPTKDISVDMRGRTIAVIDNHPLGSHAIEIYTHKNTCLYMLFAPNEQERKKWVYALAAVARLPRPVKQ